MTDAVQALKQRTARQTPHNSNDHTPAVFRPRQGGSSYKTCPERLHSYTHLSGGHLCVRRVRCERGAVRKKKPNTHYRGTAESHYRGRPRRPFEVRMYPGHGRRGRHASRVPPYKTIVLAPILKGHHKNAYQTYPPHKHIHVAPTHSTRISPKPQQQSLQHRRNHDLAQKLTNTCTHQNTNWPPLPNRPQNTSPKSLLPPPSQQSQIQYRVLESSPQLFVERAASLQPKHNTWGKEAELQIRHVTPAAPRSWPPTPQGRCLCTRRPCRRCRP